MGLKDALEAATAPRKQPSIVDEWLTGGKLNDDDAAALRAALEDPNVPHRTIERAMNEEGHTLSDSSIRRWRSMNGVKVDGR